MSGIWHREGETSGVRCEYHCTGRGGRGVCPHCGDWHADDGSCCPATPDDLEPCPVDGCSELLRGQLCPNQIRRLTVACSSCLPGRPCFACAPDDHSPAHTEGWPCGGRIKCPACCAASPRVDGGDA